MKYHTLLGVMLLVLYSIFGQPIPTNYEWKATFQVVDEDNNPVAGANVGLGFSANFKPATIDGKTDTNGIFIATQSTEPNIIANLISYRIEKDGFYFSWGQRDLGPGYDPANWVFSQTVLLKKVGRPIAMYARYVTGGPPVFNTPVGYDLMVGDWVAPNGKGITTDIVFNGKLDQKAKNDFDYTLTVSFPKPGDGIQEFTMSDAEKGGGLRSPHEAPTNGYQSQVVKTMSRHPGQGTKEDMNDPNRNYFFRVRTALDENGNVVSAHYGKIYGDFMQFTYYLNPTPNSRNIEFDTKQNLIGESPASPRVQSP